VHIKQLLFRDSRLSAVLLFYDRNQAFYIRLSTISSKSMAHINTVLNSDTLIISHITKWTDGAESSLGSYKSFSHSKNFLPLTESTGLLLCPQKPVTYPVLSHINPGQVLKTYSFKNPKKHKPALVLAMKGYYREQGYPQH